MAVRCANHYTKQAVGCNYSKLKGTHPERVKYNICLLLVDNYSKGGVMYSWIMLNGLQKSSHGNQYGGYKVPYLDLREGTILGNNY